MQNFGNNKITIREATKEEHAALGALMAAVYAALPGFPTPDEQPGYYAMLHNIGKLAEKPTVTLLVAVDDEMLLGGLVYFSNMAQYGSGGTATQQKNASGFRLLAVAPAARQRGVAKQLMEKCIAMARKDGNTQVIIHTTGVMKIAWEMYEKRGFKRSEELDFMQEKLSVFGFRLSL